MKIEKKIKNERRHDPILKKPNLSEFQEKIINYDYNAKLEGSLSEVKMSQLKNLRERIEKLKKLPKEKWNEKDHEFMKIVSNNSMMMSLLDL